MKTNLHLGFTGNCDAAFAFYETVFGTKRLMTMKYGDAPPGIPCPEGAKNLVLHASMQLGSFILMGADARQKNGSAVSIFLWMSQTKPR